MSRRLALPLASLLLLAAPASAQEKKEVTWQVGGSLRVRGFYLGNGTLARQLDPTTRLNLVLAGDEDIDSTQTYLDTRLRLQIKATAYEEVTAFMAIEVGDITFGVPGQGGDLGTDGIIFENKNLYLQWHPTRYSFKFKGGLYPRETDPYGLILSNDVAGVQGEVELLGTDTSLYADFIKAFENSRLDLDGDGLIDNDYNDRTIILAGVTNGSIPNVTLEAFFVSDIDNTQDTPVANTERDTYWVGGNVRARLGKVRLATTGIWAYGTREETGTPDTTTRGFAVDNRISVELPFVTVEGVFAWASGRDPRRRTTDTAFPVITPFYGQSGIIYGNFGGFNVTGSDLSGTAHTTLRLKTTPLKDLDVEAVFVWAWYTADRDVSGNITRFHADSRDIGFEADLNVTYHLLDRFKAFARGSIFFPGKGYLVQRDTRRRGALSQIILGAQFDF